MTWPRRACGGTTKSSQPDGDSADMRFQLQRLECLGRRSPSVDIAVSPCRDLVVRSAVRHGILINMRIDFDPQVMDSSAFYRLLTSVVVPRPIAWVSTLSPVVPFPANLAPHSFFTVACTEPPIVQFTSVGRKDTLNNVEATGEFVVNFCSEPQFEQINATGTDFPPGVGEFDAVGIEQEASLRVKPPRVAGSPVALECRLHSTLRLGNSTVVFGEVVHAAVDEDTMVDGLPDVRLLRPLSRLGRNEWGNTPASGIRDIARIRYQDWTKGE